MLEQMDFDASAPRTIFLVHALVMHYCFPWHHCLPPFLEAHHLGMSQGDVETACWAIFNNITVSFYCGKSLPALENDCMIYMKQMKDLSMDQPLASLEPYLRGMQNLMGKSQNGSTLPGAEEKIAEYRKHGSTLEGMQREVQVLLKVFFSKDEEGADIALEIAKNGVNMSESTIGFHMATFHSALLCYSAHRRTKRNRYLKLAKKHHQTIKTWAKAGNPNVVFAEQALSAEAALVAGKQKDAIEKYKAAAASAEQIGYRSYHALLTERCGDAHATYGQFDSANVCWEKAISINESWGAVALVEKIRNNSKLSSSSFLTKDDAMEHAPSSTLDTTSLRRGSTDN